MTELLYTKRELDYSYQKKTDNGWTTAQKSDFLPVELSLLNYRAMGIPQNSKASDIHAYYFDRHRGRLKKVCWRYSIQHDVRGYIESHFTFCNTDKNVWLGAEMLPELKKLLMQTATASIPVTSSALRIGTEQLFTNNPDESLLESFLMLVFMLMPESRADKVIFMNRFASVNFSFSGELLPSYRNMLSEADPLLMHVAGRTSDSYEYELTLTHILNNCFGAGIENELPETEPSESIGHLTALYSRFINAANEGYPSGKSAASFAELLGSLIMDGFARLRNKRPFEARLDEYKSMLDIFRKPENSELFRNFSDRICFSDLCPPHDYENCRNAFAVIERLGSLIIPQDETFFTKICLSQIYKADSGNELKSMIYDMSGLSVSGFLSVISADSDDMANLERLCGRLCDDAACAVKGYQGYGHDKAFSRIVGEISPVSELADVMKQPFRHMLMDICVQGNDIMRQKCLLPLCLDETVTLTELAEIVARWSVGDFYTYTDTAIYSHFLYCIQQSNLRSKSASDMAELLAGLSELCHSLEKSGDIEQSAEATSHTIRALHEVFGNENGGLETIQKFVCMSIIGNPVVVLCMMSGYHQVFLNSSGNTYKDFEPFFNMIFAPVIDSISLGDFAIMHNMIDSICGSESGIIDKIVKKNQDGRISAEEQCGRLISRLEKRYGKSDGKKLSAELNQFTKKYTELINGTYLSAYGSKYTKFMKRYLKSYIEELGRL